MGVPQSTGFIDTVQGPVMFSATQLRHSNRSGDNKGFLLFVKKVRPTLIQTLATLSQLKIEHSVIDDPVRFKGIAPLIGELQGEPFGVSRQRILLDINQQPLILLDISHQTFVEPALVGRQFIVTMLLLLLIPLGLNVFVKKYLVAPVNSGARRLRHMIKDNDLKPLPQDMKIAELSALAHSFNQLIVTINQQQQELEQISLRDGLTGIFNRRAFDLELARSWARSQRQQTPTAIIMLDIDYFKRFNDSLGHLAGDQALNLVAQTLNEQLKRGDDMVARYGGEEFVVLLSNCDLDDLDKLMSRLVDSISNLKIRHPDSEISDYVSISCGGAIFNDFSVPHVPRQSQQLLKQADDALYQAKKQGRNCGVIYMTDLL